jgi:transposase
VIEPEGVEEGTRKIGEEITEILEYEPATLFVRKIIRPKYIISSTDEKTEIAIANLPSLPIPKGNAGASMLAHIAVDKFVYYLPFYRKVKMLKAHGFEIAESTLGGWFSATCRLLEPLYRELIKQVLQTDYLQADESPIPVLTKDKPGATHKGYQWVYHDPIKRLVLFDYRKSRSREGPNEILCEFTGHLQTDGYNAYENLNTRSKIILLACMAHARRKFEHAKDNDKKRSEHAMKLIGKLYAIEERARQENLSFEQVYALRHKEAKPVLEEIKQWMDKESIKVLPKSAIGKAMTYSLKLWPRLIRYIEDGRFQIDNNLIENTIRPLALGRKNYLFAGSHDGAYNAAMMYSFFGTCRLNNIDPFRWLKKTLEVIPDHPANKLADLLPNQ